MVSWSGKRTADSKTFKIRDFVSIHRSGRDTHLEAIRSQCGMHIIFKTVQSQHVFFCKYIADDRYWGGVGMK